MKRILNYFKIPAFSSSMSNISGHSGPMGMRICDKLSASNLNPSHLQLINESYMHNVPKNSETHFKVVVVSKEFDGMPLVQRHHLVYDLLAEELKSGVHALSIVAKTPAQWEACSKDIESSPNCKGGFGK